MRSTIHYNTDSVYVPTPERPVAMKVSRTDLPNEVTSTEMTQLETFVESINKVRRCVTPHCVGELILLLLTLESAPPEQRVVWRSHTPL